MSTVTIKGESFTVSALSLGDLRNLTKEGHLAALSSMSGSVMNGEQVDATIAVVSASLARKQPQCSREWVADNIDVGEAPACLRAVLEASGLLAQGSSPNVASP